MIIFEAGYERLLIFLKTWLEYKQSDGKLINKETPLTIWIEGACLRIHHLWRPLMIDSINLLVASFLLFMIGRLALDFLLSHSSHSYYIVGGMNLLLFVIMWASFFFYSFSWSHKIPPADTSITSFTLTLKLLWQSLVPNLLWDISK